eukprot:14182923-Alexandrium_andersonii.AAC.1
MLFSSSLNSTPFLARPRVPPLQVASGWLVGWLDGCPRSSAQDKAIARAPPRLCNTLGYQGGW